MVPKFSAEDTVFVTSNPSGEKLSVPVPRGTNIVLDTPGLHYNRALSSWSLSVFLGTHTYFDSSLLGRPIYVQTLAIFERLAT
jgi:hypothetical protein